MPDTIYLVQGNCGEYSDHREWVVCAYRDEVMAQEHAKAAKEWRQERVTHDMAWEDREKLKNPYDECFYGTDLNTDWTAYGVPLAKSLPSKRRRAA